jgi:hypothetical protein
MKRILFAFAQDKYAVSGEGLMQATQINETITK